MTRAETRRLERTLRQVTAATTQIGQLAEVIAAYVAAVATPRRRKRTLGRPGWDGVAHPFGFDEDDER